MVTNSRRLSSGFGLPSNGKLDTSSLDASLALGTNDDEKEREQLRDQRRKSILARTHDDNYADKCDDSNAHRRRRRSMLHSVTHSGENDMLEVYDKCIKLSVANKINQRNTWDLGLIDYMGDVIDDGDETNFTKASCTIDASVKIYSYRVDSVHQDMFRVLGGLHRGVDQHDDDDDNDDDNVKDDDDINASRKRSKTSSSSSRSGDATLEKNESLTIRESDLVVEVDPMFHKTSSAFDEGGAKGLLLNQLSVTAGCRVVFDSSSTYERDSIINEQKNDNDKHIDVSEFVSRWLISRPSLLCPLAEDIHTACVSLRHHHHHHQTPLVKLNDDDDDDDDDDDGDNIDFIPDDDFVGDELCDVLEEDERLCDETSNTDKLCGDVNTEDIINATNKENLLQHQLNENEFDSDDTRMNVSAMDLSNAARSAASNRRVSFNARLILAPIDDDYAFADAQSIRNWSRLGATNPQWKFGQTRSGVAPRINDTIKNTAKRPKSSEFRIDMFAEPIDRDKAFQRPPRTTNTLTELALKKAETVSYVLPPDFRMRTSWLRCLFLRPRLMVRLGRASSVVPDQGEKGAWFEYNNSNDVSNYVAAFDDKNDIDDDDDDGGEFSLAKAMGDDFASPFEGGVSLNLVDKPAMVPKLDIKFAKVANKVDVKAVKQCIWSKVSAETTSAPLLSMAQIENSLSAKDISSEDESNLTTSVDADVWPSFQGIVSSVQSDLPAFTRPNTSVPFYFVCLLHLCNENDLLLKPGFNLGDFHIGRSTMLSNT